MPAPSNELSRERLQRVCDYIEVHLNGRLTLADLAGVGCLSSYDLESKGPSLSGEISGGLGEMEPAGRTLHLSPRGVIGAARHPELFGEGDKPDQHVQGGGIARMVQCQTPARRPIGHFDREDYAIAEWQEEALRLQRWRWRPNGEGAIELGRGNRRGGGQGDDLAHLPPRRAVDAERPDRRRQSPGPRPAPIFLGRLGFGPAVDVFGFALHAG
jgi:hypothetical protein